MKMHVNGIDLDVDVQGRDKHPAMIVHHGAPGLSTSIEPKLSFGPFADVCRVVTYDARGSGSSPLVPPYTHEQWVADVDEVRRRLGVERVIMCGGSYGGIIALEYALAHPDRLLALILRDTMPRHVPGRTLERALASPRYTADPELVKRIDMGRCSDDDDLRRCYEAIMPLYDAEPSAEKSEAARSRTVYHHETHNFAFSHNQPRYDVVDRLHEITVPCLVTVGRHDWICPVEDSELIAAQVPNAELVIFENSGHSPQLEEPERFQAVVRSFIKEHDLVRLASA